ncbi:MAG: hypothetical protein HY735_34250 [Verrucomicrobia bacterium]|nr:hypothetical protein [Verrucomicrobiota bacterium]
MALVLLFASAKGSTQAPDRKSGVILASPPSPRVRGALVLRQQTKLPLPDGYTLLYQQSFDEAPALRDFVMTDPAAWKYSREEKGGALELVTQSKYKPAVRSPVNIALIADKVFHDFVLEADFIQTGREYGHRDMCIFFGVTSPSRFYYVHIATAADPNAHNVYIVNDKPRTNIAKETTKGVNWGLNQWHKVRVARNTSDGTIKVYFDDMAKPIMIAEDRTFAAGHIGFGSFDDTGKMDNIRIWGPKADTKKTEFYLHP